MNLFGRPGLAASLHCRKWRSLYCILLTCSIMPWHIVCIHVPSERIRRHVLSPCIGPAIQSKADRANTRARCICSNINCSSTKFRDINRCIILNLWNEDLIRIGIHERKARDPVLWSRVYNAEFDFSICSWVSSSSSLCKWYSPKSIFLSHGILPWLETNTIPITGNRKRGLTLNLDIGTVQFEPNTFNRAPIGNVCSDT